MNNFRVGQNVVCVDNDEHADWPSNKGCARTVSSDIEQGEVYTIRWIGEYRKTNGHVFIGLRLEGVYRGRRDTPLSPVRFRPLADLNLKSLTNRKVEIFA